MHYLIDAIYCIPSHRRLTPVRGKIHGGDARRGGGGPERTGAGLVWNPPHLLDLPRYPQQNEKERKNRTRKQPPSMDEHILTKREARRENMQLEEAQIVLRIESCLFWVDCAQAPLQIRLRGRLQGQVQVQVQGSGSAKPVKRENSPSIHDVLLGC